MTRTPSARTVTRMHVDWLTCDGRGLCTELLPELLERDPWATRWPATGRRSPRCRPTCRSTLGGPSRRARSWPCIWWSAPREVGTGA
jgi:hypothetical protein